MSTTGASLLRRASSCSASLYGSLQSTLEAIDDVEDRSLLLCSDVNAIEDGDTGGLALLLKNGVRDELRKLCGVVMKLRSSLDTTPVAPAISLRHQLRIIKKRQGKRCDWYLEEMEAAIERLNKIEKSGSASSAASGSAAASSLGSSSSTGSRPERRVPVVPAKVHFPLGIDAVVAPGHMAGYNVKEKGWRTLAIGASGQPVAGLCALAERTLAPAAESILASVSDTSREPLPQSALPLTRLPCVCVSAAMRPADLAAWRTSIVSASASGGGAAAAVRLRGVHFRDAAAMIALAYAPQAAATRVNGSVGSDAAPYLGVVVAPSSSSVELAVAEFGEGVVVCVCVRVCACVRVYVFVYTSQLKLCLQSLVASYAIGHAIVPAHEGEVLGCLDWVLGCCRTQLVGQRTPGLRRDNISVLVMSPSCKRYPALMDALSTWRQVTRDVWVFGDGIGATGKRWRRKEDRRWRRRRKPHYL